MSNLNVAIYGISSYSINLMRNLNGVIIKGFIDNENSGKFIELYPIFSIYDVKKNNINVIIIPDIIDKNIEIYKNVIDYQKKYKYDLYELRNNMICKYYGDKIISKFNKEKYNKEYLLKYIDCHDIITFDIFDTLLMRKTIHNYDVFELVENRAKKYKLNLISFAKTRKIAEYNLVKKGEYNFDDIYNEIVRMTGINVVDKELLMSIEKNIELSILIPRNDIVDAYNYAKQQGKKIYIVSDMYYDDSFLTKILNINGISGFEGIYVSSDYGYNKGNGLWSIVCNNIKGNVLHIGDNYFKDGLSCVNFGIDTFIVESAVNCALESPYRNLMGMTNNIDEDNLIGLIISKVYNSPFVANNYIIENIKDFSYIFISPLVTGFMIWLLNEVKNNNYNNVLFASRDGYIISKLYNRVRKNGKYFYTSRKCAATTSYENINYINKWFPIYNANFMLSDFNNEQAEKNRNNYIKYLKNNNIYNEGVYAFVDLNSRGTTQFFLNSIFKGNLIGLYFNRFYSNMSESVPIKTYLYNIKFSDDENTILESILTSTKPSVKCFDEFGNVVFENDMQNCETKEYINQSHERIENFFCDYVDNLYCKQIINQNFVYKLFSLMHNKYFIVSEKVFNSIKIDDGEEMFNVNLK